MHVPSPRIYYLLEPPLLTPRPLRPSHNHAYVYFAGSAVCLADAGSQPGVRLRFGAGPGAGNRREFRHLHGGQLRAAAAAALPTNRSNWWSCASAISRPAFRSSRCRREIISATAIRTTPSRESPRSAGQGFNLAGGGEPERLRGTRVTLDFFDVLGRKPALGRTLHRAGNAIGIEPRRHPESWTLAAALRGQPRRARADDEAE